MVGTIRVELQIHVSDFDAADTIKQVISVGSQQKLRCSQRKRATL